MQEELNGICPSDVRLSQLESHPKVPLEAEPLRFRHPRLLLVHDLGIKVADKCSGVFVHLYQSQVSPYTAATAHTKLKRVLVSLLMNDLVGIRMYLPWSGSAPSSVSSSAPRRCRCSEAIARV